MQCTKDGPPYIYSTAGRRQRGQTCQKTQSPSISTNSARLPSRSTSCGRGPHTGIHSPISFKAAVSKQQQGGQSCERTPGTPYLFCFSPPGAGDDGDLSQPKTRIKSDFSEVSRSIYAPITFYTWNLTDSVALLTADRPARTRRAHC